MKVKGARKRDSWMKPDGDSLAIGHVQLLDELERLMRFRQYALAYLPLSAYAEGKVDGVAAKALDVLQQSVEAGVQAGFKRAAIEKLLATLLRESAKDRARISTKRCVPITRKASATERKIQTLIKQKLEGITVKLEAIPKGLEKALRALRHGLENRHGVAPDALSVFGTEERGEWKDQVAEMRRRLHDGEHPTAPSHAQAELDTSLVRYYEDFEWEEAKNLINETCDAIVADAEFGTRVC